MHAVTIKIILVELARYVQCMHVQNFELATTGFYNKVGREQRSELRIRRAAYI